MKENVRDLIYLDSKRYISIQRLRVLFWAISIIPFIMIIWGIVSINTIGLNWKSLFPLISIAAWSLLYWTFVLTIQRKKTKKTFELRFLVNGITGLFISSLFWILYASFSLFDNNPVIGFDFSLWILLFYLLCSILYIGLVVLGVHKAIFKRIKEKSQTPKALAISAIFSAILPITGVMGMYTSRILRAHASDAVQDIVGTLALVLVIFLPILAHINFVQYFYCKKYKFSCDEYGNTTSPGLELPPKIKKKWKSCPINMTSPGLEPPPKVKKNWKSRPIFKILIVLASIVGAIVGIIIVIFLVAFIKGIVSAIIN